MQSLIKFLTAAGCFFSRYSFLGKIFSGKTFLRDAVSGGIFHDHHPGWSGNWLRVWVFGILMIPVAGCTSNNGWGWDDLNPWSDDEPSYTRLESDIVAAPEPGQPVPVPQHPNAGVSPHSYAAGVSVPPSGYYPSQPPPAYYGGVPASGVSSGGCPVPGSYGWSGYPQFYHSYPTQPPPGYVPPYSPQGYPGSAVPGPSSIRTGGAPGTQFSQKLPSEQELEHRYHVLNNCTDVGGNAEIGFYCDDYE